MNHQAIEINQDMEDFQNKGSTVPIFRNNISPNSVSKSGVTYKYLSNKKVRNSSQQQNHFVTNNLPNHHQSVTYFDRRDSEGSSIFETPREKFKQKKQFILRSSDITKSDENYNVILTPQNNLKNTQGIKKEYSPGRVYTPRVNLMILPDTLAENELENASREELLHALKLLKKQNQAQERKHKNEIEAITLKYQKADIDEIVYYQNIDYRDNKIRDLENKLRDKDKEIEMLYMKMKNPPHENTPHFYHKSAKKPQNLESLQSKDISALQKNYLNKSFNDTHSLASPLRTETNMKQDNRYFVDNGIQNVDGELLQSTTHGKIKKITVWSNQEKIHGISFQYLKNDGTMLEPNINIFTNENLRSDYMDFDVEDDNDYVEEIKGKYNIKGVKDLIITSPTGKIKHFKPFQSEKSKEIASSDLDEVFTVKYDYAEKPLRIIFPNVFQYDMKSSRLNDKHDQNFYYMESTRCVSLSNPSLLYIAGLPAVKMPEQYDYNDELLAKAPMTNHYFSDNLDASGLKEIKDIGVNKINWTDSELIFFEKKVKIYKMTIYHDKEYIYGFQFLYLTSDGYQVIFGKKHVGVAHLDKDTKEFFFDSPEFTLQKIFMFRNTNEIVQKLIIQTSDSRRYEFGKPTPDKDAKEILLDIKQSSYLYGSFIIHPCKFIFRLYQFLLLYHILSQITVSRSPRDFVLSNLRVGEIKSNY